MSDVQDYTENLLSQWILPFQVFKQKKSTYLFGICGDKSSKKNDYMQVKETYKTVFFYH